MSDINIAGVIDETLIYDDPEYCCSEEGSCAYLGCYSCLLFRGNLGNATRLDETDPEQKCDRCKESYRIARGEDYTGCILDIGKDDIPVKCVLDDVNWTKDDCLYSSSGFTEENCGYWKTRTIKVKSEL